ncbi:MAG: hypothetical protein N3I35_02725 [Clostridia bacterium]|nr:hypothetical protein [Clostridia bacterium]
MLGFQIRKRGDHMPKNDRNKTFTERLYKNHVLPFGSLGKVELMDLMVKRLEDPPLDDEEETSKGS